MNKKATKKVAKRKDPDKTESQRKDAGKIVDRVPRNKFDPDKWPSIKRYFSNRTYTPVLNDDGKMIDRKPAGYAQGDFPAYIPGSYCEQRVGQKMGLRPEDNYIALSGSNGNFYQPIFTSDEQDNIEILVYTLDRELIPLKRTDAPTRAEEFGGRGKSGKSYTVLRLKEENIKPGSDQKYKFPSHDQSEITYPFIPPQLVAKWENNQKIATLVLTEGYFKAMKACMCGADVVGLGSITLFEDASTGTIYRDIKRLIVDCAVENIVILYDGDCTEISDTAYKEVDENGQPCKDLVRRPMGFLNSLKKLYSLLHKDVPGVRVWFEYVATRQLPSESKGLDDLLIDCPDETEYIIEDLRDPKSIGRYFVKMAMNSERTNLNEWFYIDTPQRFYNHNKGKLQNRPFLYRSTLYQYSIIDKELKELVSRDLMQYRRIGTAYYKLSKKPTLAKDDNGDYIMAEVLNPWSRGTILDDYGKKDKDVLQKIRKYEGFTNLPSHDNYQRAIGNYYNLYKPLVYKPNEDALVKVGCRTILSTIEHIFGQDNRGRNITTDSPDYDHNSQYDLGLDYIQLLYQNPTQNLPILCLVSAERGTGKTSFLDLLRTMFDDNTVIVGNAQMTSNFNTLICGRLIVGVDESALSDNKKFTEQLKMWSTSKEMTMEGKGKDAVQIPNFTKYILCSNDERRFIYASSDEVRFWVRKVPPFKKEDKISNILTIYQQEMPAFMAFLNQRDIAYKGQIMRMYFDEDCLHTPWLDNLLEAQRPKSEKIMRKWLHDYFMDMATEPILLATVAKLQEAIAASNPKFKTVDQDILEQYIEENMHVERWEGGKNKRFKFTINNPDSSDETIITIEGNGRPYEFKAENFISSEEYAGKFSDAAPEPVLATLQDPELAFEDNDNDNDSQPW